jgi:hypothetical protein
MPIIGFGFNKINVEKKAPIKGSINIKTTFGITGVEKSNIDLGGANGKIAKFNFEFLSSYDPKIAEIKLNGELVYFDKAERIDAIEAGWKKDKLKGEHALMAEVFNHIMGKCTLEALILEREMGLPPSVQLPKVAIQDPGKGK